MLKKFLKTTQNWIVIIVRMRNNLTMTGQMPKKQPKETKY